MAWNIQSARLNSAKNAVMNAAKNAAKKQYTQSIAKPVQPSNSIPTVNNVSNDVSESPITNLNNSTEAFIRQLSNENTAKTFAFNAEEAEKARGFSEYMSNTSHQREVEDLKRAGLNPVLSANGGATAYSASAASGNADNSAVGVLGSLYATKMNNQNAEKIANYQAEVNKYIAKLNTSNNKYIAKLETKNAKEIAKINAQASKYASDNASSASRYASDNSLYSSKYSADSSYAGTQYSTDRSKYGLIDNFVNSLIGSNKSKGNSASQNSGTMLRNGIKNLIKKYKN